MSNGSSKVDGVREVSPQEGARLKAKGIVADLSRDNLIVHVGKPVGSISGWLGTIFWQVWVEPRDTSGTVHARIDQGEAESWQFDAALSKEQILDAAKDRIVEQARTLRANRLKSAEAELAGLAA